MRTILHVDMNAYFASVEQASNPFLRGKPVAVGGGVGGKRTIVAAASYEAKARGIKNAMTAWDAKKICPDLIIVPGDMTKYIHTSSEIIKIFRDFTDLIEVFSIDEAFLDVSATKERFGGEIDLAKIIKQRIREKFRLTCTIGVSYNKLLAKLAGELKKPDGLVIIRPEDVPHRLENIKVSDLCGVGRKLEKYLDEMGIRTFGELNRYPREKLVKRFGMAAGEHLYYMGQGRDNSEVLPYREECAKSMGHSYTLPKNTSNIEEVKGYLLRLSEQVGRRLRKDHYQGNVVHLSLGFEGYTFWGKQKKVEDYLDDGYEIYKVAESLLDNFAGSLRLNVAASKSRGNRPGLPGQVSPRRFRFVGISVSNLLHHLDQVSIFEQKERQKRVLKALDEINDRYGESKIERLAVLKTQIHQKTGMVAPCSYKV